MDSLNIILFGEPGVGKSSVINLIAGRQLAKTSPDVQGCTMSFKNYGFSVDDRRFRILETVGLEEPEMGVNGYLHSIVQAWKLTCEVESLGGIDLLLFCIRGDIRITATARSNYRLFYEVLCRSKVPLALVITHLEREDVMDGWWRRNSAAMEKYGIKPAAHACVTGLRSHRKYAESRENMDRLLKVHDGEGRFTTQSDIWFAEFLRLLEFFCPLREGVRRKDVIKVLTRRCGLDLKVAEALADKRTPHSQSLNIVLFGEASVDRHSAINLIAGRTIATPSDSQGCTLSTTVHNFRLPFRLLNIWETVGLVEPKIKVNDYLRTIEQVHDLIQTLTRLGGVDLLLFCIHADHITETTESNYRLFYEVLCKSRVPISLVVITDPEKEVVMEDWWTRNAGVLEKKGFKFTRHACVTGLPSHRKYEKSRTSIARLLEGHGGEGSQTRFIMPTEEWIVESLRSFSQFAPQERPERRVIAELLANRCQMDEEVAKELAGTLGSSLNVILFGETGVGKSSTINLLAGKAVAETSPDALGCTMSFKAYEFEVGDREILVWDTVGLEEPTTGAVGYLPAILNSFDLIQELASRGGVDLLLFCIRGNRITATTQSNYRLFYEVLCKSKVPITLVVTHLEKEQFLEDWWGRNVGDLEVKFGIKSAGHACTTGIPGHSKSKESRGRLQTMLKGHKTEGKFTMPPDQWFIEFLRKFGLFAPPLTERAQRKEILKVLKNRCHMDPKDAEELADVLKGDAPSRILKSNGSSYDNLTKEVTPRTEASAQRDDTLKCDWMKGRTSRLVAMKVVIGMNTQKKYKVNLFLRATLPHENVVPLLGVVEKPMQGLITPWYNNGSLSDYLDRHKDLALEKKQRLLRDIVKGLQYIHNQDVVHGNLHNNNVLIDDTFKARLTDMSFTLPCNFIGAVWIKNCNALRFADPKLVLMAQKSLDLILSPTKENDKYSLGGLMLHVFFGTMPYGDLGRLEILQKLLRGERAEADEIPDPGSLGVPIGYKVLIQECWDPEEYRRPSLKDLVNSFGFR